MDKINVIHLGKIYIYIYVTTIHIMYSIYSYLNAVVLSLKVIPKRKGPGVAGPAHDAVVLQVVLALVRLHVDTDGVQRSKRSGIIIDISNRKL